MSVFIHSRTNTINVSQVPDITAAHSQTQDTKGQANLVPLKDYLKDQAPHTITNLDFTDLIQQSKTTASRPTQQCIHDLSIHTQNHHTAYNQFIKEKRIQFWPHLTLNVEPPYIPTHKTTQDNYISVLLIPTQNPHTEATYIFSSTGYKVEQDIQDIR